MVRSAVRVLLLLAAKPWVVRKEIRQEPFLADFYYLNSVLLLLFLRFLR
jgi:hypothetical protein